MQNRYQSFAEFYPYYLSEHQNPTCRRLHFIGSLVVLACVVQGLYLQNIVYFGLAIVSGYAFAWVGHFFFEKNKPATFQYPLFSLMGDWLMFWQILLGRVSIRK